MNAAATGRGTEVPPEFLRALRELNLVDADELVSGQALAGGVSSDIWRVDTRRGALCVKRALSRLRVAADWRAPVERNLYEARWMQVAREAAPAAVPRVRGQHGALGVLVMDYLPPEAHTLWKDQLRRGIAQAPTAQAVGATLGRIHAHAARHRDTLAAQFDTDRIFFDIRLEPYLLATAARHADLAPALQALVRQTQEHKLSLVHGDVSPKNILVPALARGARRPAGCEPGPEPAGAPPVLLDAECAWWGDPAFDLAFCLNHLLLKCLWVPPSRTGYLACFDALAAAYRPCVDWERPEALEARAARLLPGLLLARVDGKSPAEYLVEPWQHDHVRRVARQLLRQPEARLAAVRAAFAGPLEAAIAAAIGPATPAVTESKATK
ncbi:MAG: phosphotransferase [Rubrivivax sp.]|nr:phosphotransferase [Rubrivivax sp.]